LCRQKPFCSVVDFWKKQAENLEDVFATTLTAAPAGELKTPSPKASRSGLLTMTGKIQCE
jgi:hypothetical protein